MNFSALRGKVYEKGLTLSGLADQLGMNASTMFRKTHGESEFNRAEMLRIRNILELSGDEMERIFFSD